MVDAYPMRKMDHFPAGTSQAIIDYAAGYAKERIQFGKPISKFQAIQHKFADMQIKADVARLLSYRVAWMLKEGLPCFKEMSIAKLYASEAIFAIASEGVQIMGGYGVMKEYDMELFFQKMRSIPWSCNEYESARIARCPQKAFLI